MDYVIKNIDNGSIQFILLISIITMFFSERFYHH